VREAAQFQAGVVADLLLRTLEALTQLAANETVTPKIGIAIELPHEVAALVASELSASMPPSQPGVRARLLKVDGRTGGTTTVALSIETG